MSQKDFIIKRRSFKHLTAFQRGQIEALLLQNVSKTKIAEQVGIARSTLYEELKRGTVLQLKSDLTSYKRYFGLTGQTIYEKNRMACRKPFKLGQAQAFIEYLEQEILKNKLSPDAVCGKSARIGQFPTSLCTKTVYNYIDLGLIKVKNIDLPLRVRIQHKTRRCRQNRKVLGTSIEQRPEVINERREFGHWEIDTVVGKRKAGPVLLTLDERMTRKRHIVKIAGKTKEAVQAGLEQLKQYYGTATSCIFKSITSDNGSEFSDLFTATGNDTAVYFAHPYSSGERGTNEKQNSLVRRFIPKGKDMSSVTEYAINKVEQWINELPRKMFEYRSPQALFDEQLSMLNISI
jgi:transposase, IS30 family